VIVLKKSNSKLIIENICLLIPLIIYGIYKNGYLVYQKGLINFINIFKPLYLVLISVFIKLIIDLIKYKKIKIDYNLIYVIIIGMIMPYNINILLYSILFTILYILSLLLDKYLKLNKICYIYLIIILIHFLFNEFTYLNPLEQNYNFSFEFLDYLFGRNIGGISTTSIFFSLIVFIYLINNYYYKKDIPFIINITYILLAFMYFLITNNSTYLLNSELIFASIFVAPLPIYSPYKINHQIIYAIFIAILTFIISIIFDSIISIYIAIFIVSTITLLLGRLNMTK